jgi:hypothetical protein
MSSRKIIYITHIKATFVSKDTEFLEEKYQLIKFDFHPKHNLFIPFLLIRQFFFIIFNIGRCNMVICQFGGYHSLLPALFAKITSKPCLIIVAGTDAYSFPSINYGNFRKKILGLFTEHTYRLASHIVPVDESLIISDCKYYNVDYPKQGIQYFCKHVNALFETIYYGYDSVVLKNKAIPKKEKTFITIGKSVETRSVFLRKGIDLILDIAPKFPDCTFTIIGMNDSKKMPDAPSNVVYIEYIENKALMKLLAEQEFYFQLSIAEGFPNALCEAMLCECIPIGSSVAAIPKIIGNTGFILEKKDKGKLEKLIHEALKSDTKALGKAAREQIINNFDISIRKKKFYRLIDSLI